jgi:hypothetical protein
LLLEKQLESNKASRIAQKKKKPSRNAKEKIDSEELSKRLMIESIKHPPSFDLF